MEGSIYTQLSKHKMHFLYLVPKNNYNISSQLRSGGSADHYNKYLRMAESMGTETTKRFCKSIISIFGGEYLSWPTGADCERLLRMHEGRHSFPGKLGSIDCMHWYWKNCPVAWKEAYTHGDRGHPTIILEPVASHDLWIWHAFFGVTGSNSDINVLNQSLVFSVVVNGTAPPILFTANEQIYNIGYYLVGGIYPKWPTFSSSPTAATNLKVELLKAKQESARKDVERAFGVLQMRWGIIKGPSRLYYHDNMQEVMYACIILHNMIIEKEGPMTTEWAPIEDEASGSIGPRTAKVSRGATDFFWDNIECTINLCDSRRNAQLIADLIEELGARRTHN